MSLWISNDFLFFFFEKEKYTVKRSQVVKRQYIRHKWDPATRCCSAEASLFMTPYATFHAPCLSPTVFSPSRNIHSAFCGLNLFCTPENNWVFPSLLLTFSCLLVKAELNSLDIGYRGNDRWKIHRKQNRSCIQGRFPVQVPLK